MRTVEPVSLKPVARGRLLLVSSLPGYVRKYRHCGPEALRVLLPSLHRQLPYNVHLNVVLGWNFSPLPEDGRWLEGTAWQHCPGKDPGSLVWWTGIQHFLGEEPQASQACPQLPLTLHSLPLLFLLDTSPRLSRCASSPTPT